MSDHGLLRRQFLKLTSLGTTAAGASTMLFGRSAVAQPPPSTDPHSLHAQMIPFTAEQVRARARGLKFSDQTKMERAASDVMEYYDVDPPPSLEHPSPIVLGRVKFKIGGAKIIFGNRETLVPVGDYFNWIGKKDGHWLAGFASVDGNDSIPAEVLFPVEATSPHHHLQTYTHDPADAAAWRLYSLAAAGLPIPGSQLPPGAHKPPPPPPRAWRCIEVWGWVTLPTGERGCTVVRWTRVPD